MPLKGDEEARAHSLCHVRIQLEGALFKPGRGSSPRTNDADREPSASEINVRNIHLWFKPLSLGYLP